MADVPNTPNNVPTESAGEFDLGRAIGAAFNVLAGGVTAAAGPEIFKPFMENLQRERERQAAQAKTTRNNRLVLQARMNDPEWAAAFTKQIGTDDPNDAVSQAEGLSESELRLVMSGVGDELVKQDKVDSAWTQIQGDYVADGQAPPQVPEGGLTKDFLRSAQVGLAEIQGTRAVSARRRQATSDKLAVIAEAQAQDPVGGFAASMDQVNNLDTTGLSPEDASAVKVEAGRTVRVMHDLAIVKESELTQAAMAQGDFSAVAQDPANRVSNQPPDLGPMIKQHGPAYLQAANMKAAGSLGKKGSEGVIWTALERHDSLEDALASLPDKEKAKLLTALHESPADSLVQKSQHRAAVRQRDDFSDMLQGEGIKYAPGMGSLEDVDGRLQFVPDPGAVVDEVLRVRGGELLTEASRQTFLQDSTLPDEVKGAVISRSKEQARAVMTQQAIETGAPDLSLEMDNTDQVGEFTALIDSGGEIPEVDLVGAFGDQTKVLPGLGDKGGREVITVPGFKALGWSEPPTTEGSREAFLGFIKALGPDDVRLLNAAARKAYHNMRKWDKAQQRSYVKTAKPIADTDTFRNAAYSVVLPPPQGNLADSHSQAAAAALERLSLGELDLVAQTNLVSSAERHQQFAAAYRDLGSQGTREAEAAVSTYADMGTDIFTAQHGGVEEIATRFQSYLGETQNLFGEGGAVVGDLANLVFEAETISAKMYAVENYLRLNKSELVAGDPDSTARRAAEANLRIKSIENIRVLAATIEVDGNMNAASPSAAGFGGIDDTIISKADWAKFDSPQDRALLLAQALLASPRR